MLVLATLEGQAIGPTPRTSFLLDFATYVRVFVTVPLIFTTELVVGPRLRSAGLRFVEAGLMHPESKADFAAAAARAARWREALLPEVLFAVVALFGGWFISIETIAVLKSSTSWHTTLADHGMRLSLAGLWYRCITIPLLDFFLLRWLWRVVIWTRFIWDVSRLRLNLLPTHTDMAAGLGFLGPAHVTMWIFPFAMGCILAAEVEFRTVFEGLDLASLKSMFPVLVVYLVFVELVTYGPLLVFLLVVGF